MRARFWIVAVSASLLLPSIGAADEVFAGVVNRNRNNNFFNRRGVALFNPVVDVVNSGSRLVVTPTVSADRKYVTLSMSPQLSQLVAIQSFPVFGASGTVGGGNQAANVPALNINALGPVRVRNAAGGNVLNQVGMIRLGE